MNCKRWKDAATLIIAAKNPFKKVSSYKSTTLLGDSCDFKILVIKRSSKSSFMPETYVFPGGHTEAADACTEWLDLFSNFGVNVNGCQLSKETSGTAGEDIFQSNDTGRIHGLISLRISAIRETFEECGLLLCRRADLHDKNGRPAVGAEGWCSYLAGHESKQWQSKVQHNPAEFINACRYFQCYPDIWSLKKWSNWLTPTTFPKRFDAAFFLTAVDQIPPTCADNMEITEIQWLSPDKVLELAYAGDITVPIPQLYEVARLQNFPSAERLLHFAVLRDARSTQRWMSVHVACDDGTIFLLPGDDMYPAQENLEARQFVETLPGSVDELRARSRHLNRLESCGSQWRVVSNLQSDLAAGCVYPRPCPSAKLSY